MSLPFDLEDVVVVALADTLRRAGMLVFSILGGAFLANLGVLVGEAIAWRVENGAWGLDFMELSPWSVFTIPLRPLGSAWGILYVPCLVAAGFYFVRATAPGIRSVAVFVTLTGFFAVVARGEPDWFTPSWMGFVLGGTVVADPGKLKVIIVSVGLVLWVGMSGSFWFFAIFWERRNRRLAESHLLGIAHENELKREEIRLRTGGAVADRDFAVGDGEDP